MLPGSRQLVSLHDWNTPCEGQQPYVLLSAAASTPAKDSVEDLIWICSTTGLGRFSNLASSCRLTGHPQFVNVLLQSFGHVIVFPFDCHSASSVI